MSDKASEYDRKLDFGLRVHVIVRETESEARKLLAIDVATEAVGKNIEKELKMWCLGGGSEMRGLSNDDGRAEPHLFTGIKIGLWRSTSG